MTIGVQQLMVEVELVRDRFHAALFTDRDLEAALALVSPECALLNVPADTGARGAEDLRRFLAQDLLPYLPSDLAFRRVSRTVDRWRVAEETTVSFTHDRELPWLLPGVAPTHRRAEVLAVSVVSVRRSLITDSRTLWNHCGLMSQLSVPGGQALTGVTGRA